MGLKGRRIWAYIIDILFITFLLSMISEIRFLNPHYEELYDANQQYVEYLKNIDSSNISNVINSNDIQKLSYNIEKYSVSNSIITIIVYMAYFCGFQKWNKGQTLGKKITKISIQSNSGNDVSWTSYIIRTIICYDVLFSVIKLICIMNLPDSTYFQVSNVISSISYVIQLLIVFMILFRSDMRGLHDILADTKIGEEKS